MKVFKVHHYVLGTHPENTITIFGVSWRCIVQTLFGSGGPFLRVVSPVTCPLFSIVTKSMRVSQLKQDFILVLFDLKNAVSMTIIDTSSIGSFISTLSIRVGRGSETKHSAMFRMPFKFSQEGSGLHRFEFSNLWITTIVEIGKS